MNTQTTIPISKARAKIFDIAEDVQKPGRTYTFTEKGSPKAVLMSADEFDSLMETIEVNRLFPKLDKDIKHARLDLKKGSYITLDEYLTKSHDLPRRVTKKGAKRPAKHR